MTAFLAFTVLGLVTGAGYAVAASGLVLTYSTSRIFNVGHGALAMVMAFLFWELSANLGLPVWLAVLLVVGVVAPLCGVVIDRLVMSRLADAPVSTTLVVTVGVLVTLIGVAQAVWPSAARPVEPFFGQRGVSVGSAFVTLHDLTTIAAAAAVAAALYGLLSFTQTGTAMPRWESRARRRCRRSRSPASPFHRCSSQSKASRRTPPPRWSRTGRRPGPTPPRTP